MIKVGAKWNVFNPTKETLSAHLERTLKSFITGLYMSVGHTIEYVQWKKCLHSLKDTQQFSALNLLVSPTFVVYEPEECDPPHVKLF